MQAAKRWRRALLVGGFVLSLAPRIAAGTGSVQIQDFGFLPDAIDVSAGDQVTWVNTGEATHSVLSDPAVPERFDSGGLEPGKAFSHMFKSPGAVSYFCEIYPSMRGLVRVSEPGTKTDGGTTTTRLTTTTRETPPPTSAAPPMAKTPSGPSVPPATRSSSAPPSTRSAELSPSVATPPSGTGPSTPPTGAASSGGPENKDSPPSRSGSPAPARLLSPSSTDTRTPSTSSPPNGAAGEDRRASENIARGAGGAGVRALRILGLLPLAALIAWAIFDAERVRRNRLAHQRRRPGSTFRGR